jgi:hypothetical protein
MPRTNIVKISDGLQATTARQIKSFWTGGLKAKKNNRLYV